MTPLVKKEIRLLRPAFLVGCALTLTNLLLPHDREHPVSLMFILPFVFCPAMAVMLALNSFGAEVSSGNFSSLLAQPVPRLKIWGTKIALLAMELGIMAALWMAFFIFQFTVFLNYPVFDHFLDLFATVVLSGLVIFSGGLWTVLLFRQVAAAFWFTLLVPGSIAMALVGLSGDHSGEFVEGMEACVLGLYSLGGLFFARWLFLRAQDVQWTGDAVVMPKVRFLSRRLSRPAAGRMVHPRTATWQKEFQLHQSQFLLAFILLVFHFGVLAVRHFCNLRNYPEERVVLESFWSLWLVMPLIVGCAAVAEERKLGTLEGQICLPMRRRTQFGIKLAVVLALSVLLGAIAPLLLEGKLILPEAGINLSAVLSRLNLEAPTSLGWVFIWNCIEEMNHWLPVLTLGVIAAGIGAISFYASTLARNTLQTFVPAVMGILLTGFLLGLNAGLTFYHLGFLWWGPLPYFVIAPAMLLTLLSMAFRNFKSATVGWNTWWRNGLTLALALVLSVLVTTSIYHRFWDKFTPFEPPHGPARLSLSNPAKLDTQWGGLSVRLPDGRVWKASYARDADSMKVLNYLLANLKISFSGGQFITGSNWVSVARWDGEVVGLKTDGTLWISETPGRVTRLPGGQFKMGEPGKLVQFGSETNWTSLVWSYTRSVLLVKHDGTLWRLGSTNGNIPYAHWPGLRVYTPYRLGTGSNWAAVFQDNADSGLRQRDGSVWSWAYNWNTNGRPMLELEPGFTVVRTSVIPARGGFRSVANIRDTFKVGIRDDGTFRIWADSRLNPGSRYYAFAPTDAQIGIETNWVAVAGVDQGRMVTLKADGSLWLWDCGNDWHGGWDPQVEERKLQKTVPVRLGTHSDWIAISRCFAVSGGDGSIAALAADGSLWFWPLENADYFYGNDDGSGLRPLLDIPHKPQRIGSIF